MRTGRDVSPLLEGTTGGGPRPAYASPTVPGVAACFWLLVAAALLAQSAYRGGLNPSALVGCALAAVCWLFWLRRAYRNLSALGVAELRDSPASAVVWFMVPVANWLMTYPILRDLWVLSDRSDPQGQSRRRPLLVQAWWLFWAAPAVISIVSLLFFDRPGPGSAADRGQALVSADFALLAIAAALATGIIVGVNARQNASNRALQSGGEDAGL